jgi:glycosyltransferase involved in cell wall biosynthesis
MSEISICIPTYEFKGDGVKYLSELFDTLQLQTFQDFNIVVSDHSIDDEIHDFCKEKLVNFLRSFILGISMVEET